ncbi:MAG TPA: hypothetical protein VNA25_23285 [Phycisphaerae bacterium]|nr:hypothetical protein [Phycisphaerae bacterium]
MALSDGDAIRLAPEVDHVRLKEILERQPHAGVVMINARGRLRQDMILLAWIAARCRIRGDTPEVAELLFLWEGYREGGFKPEDTKLRRLAFVGLFRSSPDIRSKREVLRQFGRCEGYSPAIVDPDFPDGTDEGTLAKQLRELLDHLARRKQGVVFDDPPANSLQEPARKD